MQTHTYNQLKDNKIMLIIAALIVLTIVVITEQELKLFRDIKRTYNLAKDVENVKKGIDYFSEDDEKSKDETEAENLEIQKQAQEIKESLNDGKNSVTIKNEEGQIRYDLDGKAHNGIKTPHKHIYKQNKQNGEVKNVSEAEDSPVRMTKQDIETVKEYLKTNK